MYVIIPNKFPFPTASYHLTLLNYNCDVASLQNLFGNSSPENHEKGISKKILDTLYLNLVFLFCFRIGNFDNVL